MGLKNGNKPFPYTSAWGDGLLKHSKEPYKAHVWLEKQTMIPSEREQTGTSFSFIAPSSEV